MKTNEALSINQLMIKSATAFLSMIGLIAIIFVIPEGPVIIANTLLSFMAAFVSYIYAYQAIRAIKDSKEIEDFLATIEHGKKDYVLQPLRQKSV